MLIYSGKLLKYLWISIVNVALNFVLKVHSFTISNVQDVRQYMLQIHLLNLLRFKIQKQHPQL